MKTKTLCAGAVLLFICAFAIFAGHELLARWLANRFLADGTVVSARLATVSAALIVHGCVAVLIVPIGLLLRRFGVPVAAFLTCVWTALCTVTCRVAAELWVGVLLSGYPIVAAAATAVFMSIALAPRLSRRPWGMHPGAVTGSMPQVASAAGRSPFRKSA